ncbi:MAG TPA: sigma-70 family RNA polymerase sigma factor [Allosphingosinicella sp.]|nr:sigma-70 family RNA polymerase sigma factor [Allosphingosinicella sp.]
MAGAAPLLADRAAGEDALWHALRHEGSAAARDRLFSLYLPFARSLAGRQFRSRSGGDIEYQDLLQLGCAGLLEAIDRFDPGLGVPFKGFAVRRINGSMIDGLAKMSEVREQISYRNRVRRDRLRSLAADADAPPPQGQAMEALIDLAVGLALGFMLEGTTLYQGEAQAAAQPSAYDSLAWRELVKRVAAELARLPERDRRIIELHYLEEVNFDQIARLYGLTKGRISQLHKAALVVLRKRVAGGGGFRLER